MALTISRRRGQSIVIGDNIRITIGKTDRAGLTRLTIDAPREVIIVREELLAVPRKGQAK